MADLLLTLAAAASCDAAHRHSLFVGAPSDFISRIHGLASGNPTASPAVANYMAFLPGHPVAAGQQAGLLPWQTAVNGSVRTSAGHISNFCMSCAQAPLTPSYCFLKVLSMHCSLGDAGARQTLVPPRINSLSHVCCNQDASCCLSVMA